MSIDSNLICTCGEGTWAYFASIQLSKAQRDQDRDFTSVKGDSGFSIGEIEIEACKTCGRIAEFRIPEADRKRLHG